MHGKEKRNSFSFESTTQSLDQLGIQVEQTYFIIIDSHTNELKKKKKYCNKFGGFSGE